MTRQSWLERDPDERIVRWGWTIWLAWGVIGGALWLDDIRAGAGTLSLVLVAPFWAAWLLWPTYRGLRVWWRWQYDAALQPWNGTYYEFDGQQIRILMQDTVIWIVAADVFEALGLHGRQRDAGRVRQIAGRDGLVALPGTRQLAFTEIGIHAWLERRTDPAAHHFARWLTKQVIEPYRRRQALNDPGPD